MGLPWDHPDSKPLEDIRDALKKGYDEIGQPPAPQVWGWYCDLTEETLSYVKDPDALIASAIEMGKQRIIAEMSSRPDATAYLIFKGEFRIEFQTKQFQVTIPAGKWEDEGGGVHTWEAHEVTRVQVDGRIVW